MSSQQTNGRSQGHASHAGQDVRDELDVYNNVTLPAAGIDELQGTNYGLGVYEDTEHWQQVRSYAKGLRVQAAVGTVIEDRADRETAKEIGERKWQKWKQEGEHDTIATKIRNHAGVEPTHTPTHWRVAEMRLESSRGRDGRLLDNVFGRVVEKVTKGGEAAAEALKELGAR